jgi:uncharacterized protein YndB with AHSA1/START domain
VIERELLVPLSPEELWEELTEPASVAGWFGATVEWDLERGGVAHFLGDDGERRAGRIDAVEPSRHLRYRWWAEGCEEGTEDADASEVTYTLVPEGDSTRLRVTERRLSGHEAAPAAPVACASSSWSRWDDRSLALWSASALTAPAVR